MAAIDDLNAAVSKLQTDVAALIDALHTATPDLTTPTETLTSMSSAIEAALNPPPAEAPA